VLVELRLVEQRYAAVLEVINDAASVSDVAFRFGVTRQTVHRWLRRYAVEGLAGLADGSAKPLSCPHQMPVEVEARIVELRRLQPGWGQRTIRFRLEADRVDPLPSLSAIYRCLVRHQLIVPEARRRKKGDYRRWERSRSMELWQMDVVGGVRLVNGWKASIVSGIDDHSRFIISAHVVERATARPVCEALTNAMRTHGLPRGFDGQRQSVHRSAKPRPSSMVGCMKTTTIAAIKALVMLCRGNDSDSPPPSRRCRSNRRWSRRRRAGLGGPARSVSLRCCIRSGCGSTVKPSTSLLLTAWCRSTIKASSSRRTRNVIGQPRRSRR